MRLTLLTLISGLLLLQYQFWTGDGGLAEMIQLQTRVDSQRVANGHTVERNQRLRAEVIDLKQGYEAIEERGRRDLGLIMPGETFFQIIDQRPTPQSLRKL